MVGFDSGSFSEYDGLKFDSGSSGVNQKQAFDIYWVFLCEREAGI